MTAINVLFGKRAGKIAELQLDANISEHHSYDNDITQFPIESGATISDHVRLRPDEVEIEGFITNSPIQVVYEDMSEVIKRYPGRTEVLYSRRGGEINRVETALDVLLRISGRKVQGENQDPELVDIVTGLRVYTNMMIRSLIIPRFAEMGQSLHFTATFTKMQFAIADVVPQSVFKDKAQWQIDKSNQTPKNTTKKQKSLVSKIKKWWNAARRRYNPEK